ncbi:o-succinylbenzoate--CoA ligase [Motilibacter aurantiacus]|uniref:o-succinylbenzoate--CoA ligase n=1 Tax=Motilibacter aurantiacus TaxID=2714955 RepID=UPI00140C3EA4|nr:o-succinylbenzoate--CoA ligase [Motilibacter aurantiacus]NHC44148.1 AMP-binding protein [Motilibacter aurantiacus]
MPQPSVAPLTALPAPTGTDVVRTFVPALAAALDGTGPALLPLPPLPAPARARALAALRPDDPAAPLERDDVVVVVPTSGSTGDPKGSLLQRSALQASAAATAQRLGGPAHWLLALGVGHVAGLQVVARSLLAGTEPEVLDVAAGFTCEAFVAATGRLRRRAPRAYTSLVPTQLTRLLDGGPAAHAALTSYDAVLVGGAATPTALLARARSAGVRVVTTYGMSETCGGCVYDGAPLDGVGVALEDDGRIVLSGPVVAAGYRLRPGLTAERFGPAGFRTDDLGERAADGRLRVLGRADDVVVTGGEKVALAAVEDAAAGHPGVREAAAFSRPDPEWGERVLLAVVPTDPAAPPALDDVRAAVRDRAGRAAAPRELVLLPALPLLPSGKVDRAALRGARP